MSQGVNVKFAKCFIIFMAIAILLQGVVYLGLSLYGIKLHNCSGENSNPVSKPFEFVLNLVYFSSEECGSPKIHIPEVGEDLILEIDFSKAASITDREFIILVAYIAISALWILTSLFVLVTICCTLTKRVVIVCFWPWFLSVVAGSILDGIATGYHVNDIFKTTSSQETFEYVGVKNAESALEYLKGYDVFFMAPAVAFSCISSRIVLIWILNIFGAIFCISLAKNVSSNVSRKNRDAIQSNSSSQTQTKTNGVQEIQQEDTVALRYPPSAPSPETVQQARRTLVPIESPPDEIISPVSIPRPLSALSKNKRVHDIKTQASIAPETSTYQSSDAHPENLDYPNNRYSSPVLRPPSRPITPELSAISPLNLRYSTNENIPFAHQSPHITEELRGQLPWSYTNIMNDPVAQKRIQAHLKPDLDEDLPPIPVPDYTLHPPKKDRGSVNQDKLSQTGHSRW